LVVYLQTLAVGPTRVVLYMESHAVTI